MSVIEARFAAYLAAKREIEGKVGVWPPWHLRGAHAFDKHPVGDTCDQCGRDIAVEREVGAARLLCLYCGMVAGYVEMIEIAPEDDRKVYGVFKAECPATSR